MALDQYGGEAGMVGYTPYDYTSRKDERRSAGKSAGIGAASGAASGAAIGGQVGGGYGAAIGAAIGLVAGALGGGLKGFRRNNENRRKENAWAEAERKLAKERYDARVRAHNLAKLSFSPANNLLGQIAPGMNFDMERTPWGSAPTGTVGPVGPATARPPGYTSTRSTKQPDTWSPDQYRQPPPSKETKSKEKKG